jgi:hypothetical protein
MAKQHHSGYLPLRQMAAVAHIKKTVMLLAHNSHFSLQNLLHVQQHAAPLITHNSMSVHPVLSNAVTCLVQCCHTNPLSPLLLATMIILSITIHNREARTGCKTLQFRCRCNLKVSHQHGDTSRTASMTARHKLWHTLGNKTTARFKHTGRHCRNGSASSNSNIKQTTAVVRTNKMQPTALSCSSSAHTMRMLPSLCQLAESYSPCQSPSKIK